MVSTLVQCFSYDSLLVGESGQKHLAVLIVSNSKNLGLKASIV